MFWLNFRYSWFFVTLIKWPRFIFISRSLFILRFWFSENSFVMRYWSTFDWCFWELMLSCRLWSSIVAHSVFSSSYLVYSCYFTRILIILFSVSSNVLPLFTFCFSYISSFSNSKSSAILVKFICSYLFLIALLNDLLTMDFSYDTDLNLLLFFGFLVLRGESLSSNELFLLLDMLNDVRFISFFDF